jgi:hypothetical protein
MQIPALGVVASGDGGMGKWIDFVALLFLTSASVTGGFLINLAVPIPDSIVLSLFGTGIISSVILIKTEGPLDKERVRLYRDTQGLDA